MRQEVEAFIGEHMEAGGTPEQTSGHVEGLGSIQGFSCSVCRYGYRNLKSFKVHTRRGCPGNAVPSTLQPQLVGRHRRLVPVENDEPAPTHAHGVGQNLSVATVMRLVEENLNGTGRSVGDTSIKDAFHAEVKWDRFMLIGGSFDAAMALRTASPEALVRQMKQWLNGVVSELWERDHLLKMAVMKVR